MNRAFEGLIKGPHRCTVIQRRGLWQSSQPAWISLNSTHTTKLLLPGAPSQTLATIKSQIRVTYFQPGLRIILLALATSKLVIFHPMTL